jgi:hypothetical protein
MSNVTHLLSAIRGGDRSAASQLLPLLYDELRKLAAQKLSHEAPAQTLEKPLLCLVNLLVPHPKPHTSTRHVSGTHSVTQPTAADFLQGLARRSYRLWIPTATCSPACCHRSRASCVVPSTCARKKQCPAR